MVWNTGDSGDIYVTGCPSMNKVAIFRLWAYRDIMGHMKNIGHCFYFITNYLEPCHDFLKIKFLLN